MSRDDVINLLAGKAGTWIGANPSALICIPLYTLMSGSVDLQSNLFNLSATKFPNHSNVPWSSNSTDPVGELATAFLMGGHFSWKDTWNGIGIFWQYISDRQPMPWNELTPGAVTPIHIDCGKIIGPGDGSQNVSTFTMGLGAGCGLNPYPPQCKTPPPNYPGDPRACDHGVPTCNFGPQQYIDPSTGAIGCLKYSRIQEDGSECYDHWCAIRYYPSDGAGYHLAKGCPRCIDDIHDKSDYSNYRGTYDTIDFICMCPGFSQGHTFPGGDAVGWYGYVGAKGPIGPNIDWKGGWEKNKPDTEAWFNGISTKDTWVTATKAYNYWTRSSRLTRNPRSNQFKVALKTYVLASIWIDSAAVHLRVEDIHGNVHDIPIKYDAPYHNVGAYMIIADIYGKLADTLSNSDYMRTSCHVSASCTPDIGTIKTCIYADAPCSTKLGELEYSALNFINATPQIEQTFDFKDPRNLGTMFPCHNTSISTNYPTTDMKDPADISATSAAAAFNNRINLCGSGGYTLQTEINKFPSPTPAICTRVTTPGAPPLYIKNAYQYKDLTPSSPQVHDCNTEYSYGLYDNYCMCNNKLDVKTGGNHLYFGSYVKGSTSDEHCNLSGYNPLSTPRCEPVRAPYGIIPLQLSDDTIIEDKNACDDYKFSCQPPCCSSGPGTPNVPNCSTLINPLTTLCVKDDTCHCISPDLCGPLCSQECGFCLSPGNAPAVHANYPQQTGWYRNGNKVTQESEEATLEYWKDKKCGSDDGGGGSRIWMWILIGIAVLLLIIAPPIIIKIVMSKRAKGVTSTRTKGQ